MPRSYTEAQREVIREQDRLRYPKERERRKAHAKAFYHGDPERGREVRRAYRDGHLEEERQRRAARYEADPEEARALTREWGRLNPQKKAATNKVWADANPDKMKEIRDRAQAKPANQAVRRESRKAYLQTHKGEMNARTRARQAGKANATPKWLSGEQKELAKAFYRLAAVLGYHVDHIIPLKGKNVCGLHVHWNLQLLSPAENLSKGNRHA